MLYRQNLPKFLLGFAPLAHPLLTSPPCIDLPLPFPLLQLGTGDLQDRMIPTEVPLALESEAGQLVRAMQVHCGAQHTLALVQLHGQHQVRSVGGNNYGELGLGDRVERHRFHPIPSPPTPTRAHTYTHTQRHTTPARSHPRHATTIAPRVI